MRKSAIFLLNGGYWLGYLLLCGILLAAISQTDSIPENEFSYYAAIVFSVAIVPAIATYLVFYFFLFPRFLQKRKLTEAVIYGLLTAVASWFIAVISLFITADMGWSCHGESDYISILIVSFISLINGVIAYIIRGFTSWYEEIKLKEELQEKNHTMEMTLLKSQLDPHFLFNTLNNIDILILKDPKKASAYLNQLSDIMRFMLFETKTGDVSLEKELEYITKYIELQKIRTSNKAYVNYEVDGCPDGKQIAPMVFIPFIENAFKHTNNKKLKDAIDIHFDVDEVEVTMVCENKIDPERNSSIERNGLGNGLIARRLELIYKGLHRLDVTSHNNLFRVSLTVPYEKV